jgi:N-acetylglutamate synthase-like GNAT family acetyltransferase
MTLLRTARHADIPVLQSLIGRSGRQLSAGFYTAEQAEALTRYVFGVDTQLIDDETYLVIEQDRDLVACGGWSKRRTLFGGDQTKTGPDPLLDPATDAARIRAFFVEPEMARRGLGRQILNECVKQAAMAGFRALELASTLPGEPLYIACGFSVIARFEVNLPGGVCAPLARMRREI